MEPSIVMGQSYVADTGEVCNDGEFGCIDSATGKAVAGQVGTGLVLFGLFDIGQNKSVTGNNSDTVRIKFFQPGQVLPCAVTGTAPKVGETVYIAGPATVRLDDTGASVAGVVVKVSGTTYYVRPAV